MNLKSIYYKVVLNFNYVLITVYLYEHNQEFKNIHENENLKYNNNNNNSILKRHFDSDCL